MLNYDKKLYGLLGKNIGYSLSPALHNAAFRHFSINAEYELFDTEDIDGFFRDDVLTGKISGFNVTVPYKIDVYDKLSKNDGWEILKPASFLSAVNTVKVEEGKLTGQNTDGLGFYQSLASDTAGVDEVKFYEEYLKGKSVFVFGAGGAGRTISMTFATLDWGGPQSIYVYDIDDARVKELEEGCENIVKQKICKAVKKNNIEDIISKCSVVVNATPLGTKEGDVSPIPVEFLKEDMVVYDLVYARRTELIEAAEKKNIKNANGLGMLINQAALAFIFWNKEKLPNNLQGIGDILLDVMKKAALEELARRQG